MNPKLTLYYSSFKFARGVVKSLKFCFLNITFKQQLQFGMSALVRILLLDNRIWYIIILELDTLASLLFMRTRTNMLY